MGQTVVRPTAAARFDPREASVFDTKMEGLNPGHALTRAGSNFEAADLVELIRVLLK